MTSNTENDMPPSTTKISSVLVDDQDRKDYGSARAYAAEVSRWCDNARLWMAQQQYAMQMAHQYASICAYNTVQQQRNSAFAQAFGAGAAQPAANVRRLVLRINLPHILRGLGGGNGWTQMPQTLIVQRFRVPSFMRRIAAEAIDFCLLFLLKLVFLYMLVDMEIVDIDQLENLVSKGADMQTIINFTQELFNIEIVCKIVSSILEAMFISYGFLNYPRGSTPGKRLMRLVVISCEDAQPVSGQPDQVLVTSRPYVYFKNSLLRSFLKNIVTVFLFPLSTAFYVFQFNRAIYDIASRTIVVQI